jgi:hypothetical protein
VQGWCADVRGWIRDSEAEPCLAARGRTGPLFLGLGVAGTAAGAALGTVGAAPTDSRPGYGHHPGNDAQRFPSVGR